jgi:hypothetical protein
MWAIEVIIFSSLFNLAVICGAIGAVTGYYAGLGSYKPKDKEQAKCDSES